jgi:hypothetical protein
MSAQQQAEREDTAEGEDLGEEEQEEEYVDFGDEQGDGGEDAGFDEEEFESLQQRCADLQASTERESLRANLLQAENDRLRAEILALRDAGSAASVGGSFYARVQEQMRPEVRFRHRSSASGAAEASTVPVPSTRSTDPSEPAVTAGEDGDEHFGSVGT